MNAQQLLDCIIVPTLKYMGGGYNSKEAQMLLLATAAAESRCGYYIKQIEGPALGPWQMEPTTSRSMWQNCDVLRDAFFSDRIAKLTIPFGNSLVLSPAYACAMARLKYAMDTAPLPRHDDMLDIYDYYKRIYNTPLGASTLAKFKDSWEICGLHVVELR